ncbi:MAG: cation:proton antiporter [Pirellulales bacterium]|nr:cation:proton antiporter [Pirellulales bacterium]
MADDLVVRLVGSLLVVLAAGLAAGAVCRRLGVSMLVGYLLVGTVLSAAVPGWPGENAHEMEYLAQAGVLLLLFSIGIEFSLAELRRLLRPMLVGGAAQMLLVAGPVAGVLLLRGHGWQSAVLLGAALGFSSTVLVFKALEEWGQTASSHGRRAVAILLFQDAAVVPLLLVIPLLTGQGEAAISLAVAELGLTSLLFLVAVPVARRLIIRWVAPWLARLRSVELVVLFALVVLSGSALASYGLGLPPMVGALAAGLALNGNRLTRQIDAVLLAFRETFAAVFFVSLGTLIRFDALAAMPWMCLGALAGVLALKTTSAAAAMRLAKLPWKGAWGMGLGLAQIGEFSFVLLVVGAQAGLITPAVYNLVLFVAVATLVLTPQLLKYGLRLAETGSPVGHEITILAPARNDDIPQAVVIGIGPIGARAASQLETKGYDVCLVDLSPVNLHPFAQQGFRTVVGNASETPILRRAGADHCALAVVTVPDDRAARRIVAAIRRANRAATILVRCRFQASVARLRAAGATDIFSEETEVAARVAAWVDRQG